MILEVIEKIALLAPLSAKSVLDTQPRINQPNVIGETEPPIFDEQTWQRKTILYNRFFFPLVSSNSFSFVFSTQSISKMIKK